MTVFAKYADHYDLYYKDKDYRAEADFVLRMASQAGLAPTTLLDMGCGTGRHLVEFCKAGLACDGFDLSPQMLEQARARLEGTPCELTVASLTDFSGGKRYDLVVSMFAVMGYLVTNKSLLEGIRTAAAHLRPGGLFVFDGWFGPAVLAERPEKREHSYANGNQTVVRRVSPALDPVRQTVTVHYDIETRENERVVNTAQEDHKLRLFFVQEMELALGACGMELLRACPFMRPEETLSLATWNASFVARCASNSGRSTPKEG